MFVSLVAALCAHFLEFGLIACFMCLGNSGCFILDLLLFSSSCGYNHVNKIYFLSPILDRALFSAAGKFAALF